MKKKTASVRICKCDDYKQSVKDVLDKLVLNLGERFSGTSEDKVLKSARIFDWTGVPETDKMDELKEYGETQMDVLIAH